MKGRVALMILEDPLPRGAASQIWNRWSAHPRQSAPDDRVDHQPV